VSAQTVELAALLAEAFSVAEARRLISRLDVGDEVLGEVSENLGIAVHADQVIEALRRRGALNDAFFLALLEARPARRDRVVPLWDALDTREQPAATAAEARPRRRWIVALAPFGVSLLACLLAWTLALTGRAFTPTEAGTLLAPVVLAAADLASLLRAARARRPARAENAAIFLGLASLSLLVVAFALLILDVGPGPLAVLIADALAVGGLTLAARALVEGDA